MHLHYLYYVCVPSKYILWLVQGVEQQNKALAFSKSIKFTATNPEFISKQKLLSKCTSVPTLYAEKPQCTLQSVVSAQKHRRP